MRFRRQRFYGAWDREFGGWVSRLRIFLDNKLKGAQSIRIYNQSVSGDDTEHLLKRFETEAEARLLDSEKEDNIIIFAIGTNDSQYVHGKAALRVSEKRFRQNVEKLISLARKFTEHIIFVGFIPVDETRTVPVSWAKNKSYKNEYLRKYNGIIKEVCSQNNAHFIEFF